MAITQNTLIGRSQNKVGGTVFSTWKGKNVLKSKPLTVANPQTAPQQGQRGKLSFLVLFFRAFLSVIRYSFTEVSVGSTEWASFIKYNLKTNWSGSAPNFTFNPVEFVGARGTLVNAPNMVASSVTQNGFDVSWTNNAGAPGANGGDIFAYAAFDGLNGVRMEVTMLNRDSSGGTIEFETQTGTTPNIIHGWFVSPSQRKSSDSRLIFD